MEPLIPPEVAAQFTSEEILSLAHYLDAAEERADSDRRAGTSRHYNFYDELVEISVGYRKQVEAGDLKGATIARAHKIIDIVAAGRWRSSRSGLQERVTKFSRTAMAFIRMNPPLIAGVTPAERLDSFALLRNHAEALWKDAVLLYKNDRFARACFLAITSIEETGKAALSRVALKIEAIAGTLDEVPLVEGRRRENPFFAHKTKHFLAAVIGAICNSRMATIFGEEELDRLIDTMETGGLADLRERCLYVSHSRGQIQWPEDTISPSIASKWLVVAAELLAEVLGFPEPEWVRLIDAAQAFESSVVVAQK